MRLGVWFGSHDESSSKVILHRCCMRCSRLAVYYVRHSAACTQTAAADILPWENLNLGILHVCKKVQHPAFASATASELKHNRADQPGAPAHVICRCP